MKLALLTLLLFQSQGTPQTSFGFGAALAHAHPAGGRFYVTGVFCGRNLVTDPANTEGNIFYGNAVCVDTGAGPRWYWYDWGADRDASVKLIRWTSETVVITLQVADPECLLALSAVEGTPTLISRVSGGGVYRSTATLTATLTSGGSPLGGKAISFTLNGSAAGTSSTDAKGIATLSNVSLSGIDAGSYDAAVGAAFAGDMANIGSSATGVLTVSRADQAITFAPLADKTFGDAPFMLSASSSSGLPVNFGVLSGPASVSGGTLNITGAGTVTVRASQAGDVNYNAAAPVERSFNVARAGQAITFGAPADRTFGDPDFHASATASSGLAVSFTASGTCSASGSTVHVNAAGSCTITASQSGDANFVPAPNVARTFQIAKAATTTAVSSSAVAIAQGRPLTFTATVASAAVVPTGLVQFKADGVALGSPKALNALGVASVSADGLPAGVHVVTAEYAGDANFNPSAGTLAGGQVVGAVFEFAQALFNVNERDGSVVVTVRRRGDASQAAAVEYATDDGSVPSVPIPCSSVTGAALERCDYTRAQGLLQFAAGETEKTFSVLVNDDAYVEGAETTRVRLSNPTAGAALGDAPSATINITDDTQQATNPLSGSEFFVRQQYHDFLLREPDEDGLKFWRDEIEGCGADAQCREVKRVNVSAAFFLSIEFQETGYLVYRTYKAAYGDAASPNVAGTVPAVRLVEFLPDTRRIGQGVIVGQDAWQAQLEANKAAYFEEFVSRQRFKGGAPSNLTPAAFVGALYTNAGVTPTDAQRQAAIDEFGGASDTANVAARARALRRVAEDPALHKQELNRAFVLMEYYGYLRRNPSDAPEPTLNFAGWKFWLDKLNQFDGDFIKAEMVKAFISSDEYRHRFGL